jgi:hypothetical protein
MYLTPVILVVAGVVAGGAIALYAQLHSDQIKSQAKLELKALALKYFLGLSSAAVVTTTVTIADDNVFTKTQGLFGRDIIMQPGIHFHLPANPLFRPEIRSTTVSLVLPNGDVVIELLDNSSDKILSYFSEYTSSADLQDSVQSVFNLQVDKIEATLVSQGILLSSEELTVVVQEILSGREVPIDLPTIDIPTVHHFMPKVLPEPVLRVADEPEVVVEKVIPKVVEPVVEKVIPKVVEPVVVEPVVEKVIPKVVEPVVVEPVVVEPVVVEPVVVEPVVVEPVVETDPLGSLESLDDLSLPSIESEELDGTLDGFGGLDSDPLGGGLGDSPLGDPLGGGLGDPLGGGLGDIEQDLGGGLL